jgi:hypothetical protein
VAAELAASADLGLDPALAVRPRPALPRPARRAPPIEALLLAWVVLFVVTAVGGRLGAARPMLGSTFCLAVGAAGAAACSWAAAALVDEATDAGPRDAVRVLEGAVDAEGGARWVQVDRARGALALGPDVVGRVRVADGRPVRTCLDLRGDAPVALVEAGPGVGVDLVRGLEPGLRVLDPAVNTWSGLEAAWRRDEAGIWTSRGPWAFGEPLPEPIGPGEPPAWCVLGLPSGAPALVGRLEPGGFGGAEGAGPPEAAGDGPARPDGAPVTWIRMSSSR